MYTYFRPCGLWPFRTSWLLSPSANMDMKGWAFAPLAKAFQDLRSPAVFPSDCDSGMAAIKFTLLSWRRERLQLSWPSHTAIMQIETVPSLPSSFPLFLSYSLIPSASRLAHPYGFHSTSLSLQICKYLWRFSLPEKQFHCITVYLLWHSLRSCN